MKNAYTAIITALIVMLGCMTNAQEYRPKSEAVKIADQVDASAKELANHVESMLTMMHGQISNAKDPQAILDAYGTAASKVLADYAALYQAVKSIKPDTKVPAPDLTVFVPNPDGTVTYIAPPKPKPEPPAPLNP